MAGHCFVGFPDRFGNPGHRSGLIRSQNSQASRVGLDMVSIVLASPRQGALDNSNVTPPPAIRRQITNIPAMAMRVFRSEDVIQSIRKFEYL
jgi:hypothetical protein